MTRYSRKVLSDIPKTVHGGQAWKLGHVEDFSHNLNPFGPPECLSEIVKQAAEDVDHYPDDSCAELKKTISHAFRIKEDNLVMGAGSSEIIRNFPHAFMEPGEKALLNRPSFAEYGQQCKVAGIETLTNDLLQKDDLRIDPDKLSERISSGIKALYICNPNNPTGRIEPRRKVLDIVKECEDNGVLVFLDETLLELVFESEKISCVEHVDKFDNLLIARSLTKSFAIPGIRIGFGISNENMIEEMNKVRMTWNIGSIEQRVAEVLMSDHMNHVLKAAQMMSAESKVMHSGLMDAGFPIGRVSDSFFYFSPLDELGMDSPGFRDLMLKEGIMVRDCSSFGEGFDRYVRFSVKDRERNDMFVKAVDKVMKGDR